MKKPIRIIIPALIYLAGFIIVSTNVTIVADRLDEYNHFLYVISTGGQPSFNLGLISSSLIATWLPAQIHLITGLEAMTSFNMIPNLIFPLVPLFTYFISRKYFSIKLSIVSALLAISSFYFILCPSHGRVSIAWGFSAVFLWAVINRKIKTAIVSSILLTLSHYGTTYLIVVAVVATLIVLIIIRLRGYKINKDLKVAAIVSVCLVLSMGLWYNLIAVEAGKSVESFVVRSIMLESPTTIDRPIVLPDVPKEEAEIIKQEFKESSKIENLFKWESREKAVQVAFGQMLPIMTTPQKIEWAISWIVVIMITAGVAYMVRARMFTSTHTIMAIVFWMLIVVSVILPFVGIGYGVIRAYFTTIPILAPCFILVSSRLSKKLKLKEYLLPYTLAGIQTLAVSGIIHSWFGIVK